MLFIDWIFFEFPNNNDVTSQIIGYAVVAAFIKMIITHDDKRHTELTVSLDKNENNENDRKVNIEPTLGFYWVFYMFMSVWTLCIGLFGSAILTVWHVIPVLIIGFCITIYLNKFAEHFELTVHNVVLRLIYILSTLITIASAIYVLLNGDISSPF